MSRVRGPVSWRTAKEVAEDLGLTRERICTLARQGRFGPNAYKKFAKELNYNGCWMIPFPYDYKKRSVGQPRKEPAHIIEL